MEQLGERISLLLLLLTIMNLSASPYPLFIVLSYAVYEVGHLFFAKIVGAGITDFKTSLCRLSIKYDCTSISYFKESLVCGGGVIFNLAFFAVFSAPVFRYSEKLTFFSLCNLSLALMNLYPVSVLDGGGVLRCTMYSIFNEKTAERVLKLTSFIFAFVLWLFAVYLQLVFSSNISMFFISILLLIELCFSL